MNDRQFTHAHDRYLAPPDGPEPSPQSEEIAALLDGLFEQLAAKLFDDDPLIAAFGDAQDRIMETVDRLADDYLREKERECVACAKREASGRQAGGTVARLVRS